eukprot:TRINITY_DN8794_c0_g2_i4.p1 TRINITY_DN8794_c0_g2~~TRINITY_DN8794_c0_g2_i4.p1  ORF type:complete len:289 (+),score=30.34 TRINITY_DN8794_c0_g2_i4:91-957(+)
MARKLAAYMAGHQEDDPRLVRESDERKPLLSATMQTPEPAWWFALGRMHSTARIGVVLFVATFLACYGLWVRHGCEAFLPLVSEFGLHAGINWVFSIGLIFSCFFLGCTMADTYFVRWYLCQGLVKKGGIQYLNMFHLVTGIVVVFGVGGVGFFEVDSASKIHLTCGSIVAFGGFVWALVNFVLSFSFRGLKPRPPHTHIVQGCLVLLYGVSLVLLILSTHSIMADGKFETATQDARDDFRSYCKPGGTRTQGTSIMAAASEWLVLASLSVSFLTVQHDMQLHRSFQY